MEDEAKGISLKARGTKQAGVQETRHFTLSHPQGLNWGCFPSEEIFICIYKQGVLPTRNFGPLPGGPWLNRKTKVQLLPVAADPGFRSCYGLNCAHPLIYMFKSQCPVPQNAAYEMIRF